MCGYCQTYNMLCLLSLSPLQILFAPEGSLVQKASPVKVNHLLSLNIIFTGPGTKLTNVLIRRRITSLKVFHSFVNLCLDHVFGFFIFHQSFLIDQCNNASLVYACRSPPSFSSDSEWWKSLAPCVYSKICFAITLTTLGQNNLKNSEEF